MLMPPRPASILLLGSWQHRMTPMSLQQMASLAGLAQFRGLPLQSKTAPLSGSAWHGAQARVMAGSSTSRPKASSQRAFSSGSQNGSRKQGHRQRQGGSHYSGGHTHAFSMSGAHVVGAMAVISLPALGKSLVVLCEAKAAPPPPARRMSSPPPPPAPEAGGPATLADLMSILEGEWAWLALAVAVTLAWVCFQNFMPVAYSAVTLAVQRKESMDVPVLNFIKLQITVMVLDSARHFVLATLGERVRQRLRVRLYAAMLQQEIGFFDANSKGQLMSLMGEDVVRMQVTITSQLTYTLHPTPTPQLQSRNFDRRAHTGRRYRPADRDHNAAYDHLPVCQDGLIHFADGDASGGRCRPGPLLRLYHRTEGPRPGTLNPKP